MGFWMVSASEGRVALSDLEQTTRNEESARGLTPLAFLCYNVSKMEGWAGVAAPSEGEYEKR